MVKSLKLATLLMTILLLQSCLKENNDFNPVVIGTAKVVNNEVSSTHFILDTGYTLLPNNIEELGGKQIKDNQRVFIQLKDVEEDSSKKELHGTIIMLVKIKTQEIEFTENLSSASELLDKSDPINIGDAYVVNGFLTLKYHFRSSQSPDKHEFKMYALKDLSAEKENTYQLFLTHNTNGDNDGPVNSLFMSFPIENIQEQVDSHDKTVITFKTYYSGNENYTVYINKKK